MKNVFWIFRRDLQRIGKNFVAIIVAIGICIVPALYAWFNIGANIDPYENTSGIHIAVANCDEGSENELTGRLDAGQAVVENLEANDALGWAFTGRQEAIEGVESGEYYAAIIIPEKFSADLVSVLTGEIETPKLEYYVNEKKNAIAPKVTDQYKDRGDISGEELRHSGDTVLHESGTLGQRHGLDCDFQDGG